MCASRQPTKRRDLGEQWRLGNKKHHADSPNTNTHPITYNVMQAATRFSRGVREVWQWMDEREADLELLTAPSEDLETLQQQIGEIEVMHSSHVHVHYT